MELITFFNRYPGSNRLNKKISNKIGLKSTTLCLLILVFSVDSSAAEINYYWQIQGNLTRHSTAEAACQWYWDNAPFAVSYRQNLERPFASVSMIGAWYYAWCKAWPKSGDVTPRTYAEFAYVRYGSSCAVNNNNPITAECTNDEQKGPPETCPSAAAGNPINFAIGNKFQTETDYRAGANSTLSFVRNYNSLDGLWRHSLSTYLRFAGTQYVSVVMAQGRESFFTVSGTTVTPISADLGVLSKVGTTGWQYTSTANERFTFNTAGKLTQWSDAHGAVQQFRRFSR